MGHTAATRLRGVSRGLSAGLDGALLPDATPREMKNPRSSIPSRAGYSLVGQRMHGEKLALPCAFLGLICNMPSRVAITSSVNGG